MPRSLGAIPAYLACTPVPRHLAPVPATLLAANHTVPHVVGDQRSSRVVQGDDAGREPRRHGIAAHPATCTHCPGHATTRPRQRCTVPTIPATPRSRSTSSAHGSTVDHAHDTTPRAWAKPPSILPRSDPQHSTPGQPLPQLHHAPTLQHTHVVRQGCSKARRAQQSHVEVNTQ